MASDGVVVTLDKIYEKLVELEVRLGDHPKQLDDHEQRIRNLEMKVWGFAGISGVMAVIASLIISKVVRFFAVAVSNNDVHATDLLWVCVGERHHTIGGRPHFVASVCGEVAAGQDRPALDMVGEVVPDGFGFGRVNVVDVWHYAPTLLMISDAMIATIPLMPANPQTFISRLRMRCS